MSKKLHQEWLEILQSGNYTLASSILKNTEDEVCCLGVLYDIYNPPPKRTRLQKFRDYIIRRIKIFCRQLEKYYEYHHHIYPH